MVLAVVILAGVCLFVSLFIWASSFQKKRDVSGATIESVALAPIVGRADVSLGERQAWHQAHAASIERWIEHHQRVLEEFADTQMAIDLTANPINDDDGLGPAMDLAIAKHPDSQMRAQLSRLAGASRDTLEALRRSNWSQAKAEHVVYIQHRDAWLAHTRTVTRDPAARDGEMDDDSPTATDVRRR